MLGTIIGDIIGSIHEGTKLKRTNFKLFQPACTFTDDTVLTLAVADALMNDMPYPETIKLYAQNYPNRGYGGMFRQWLQSADIQPYNSFGNGSAMRVSSVAWAFEHLYEVLAEAKITAEATHNHPEGIKGAEAIAAAIFLARKGSTKEDIRTYIQETFGYDMNRTIASIRPNYGFDATCQGTVPEAIIAFLDSRDYETCIRLAISLSGDVDTLAAMAGGIAQAFYRHIPYEMVYVAQYKLGKTLWSLVEQFNERYNVEF